MRILWLTVDRSHRVAQHFDHFRQTMSTMAEVVTLKKYPAGDKGQNMWQLSHKLLEGAINTAGLIVEQGIVSAPDMAALILTPGSYLTSRSQELSNERAKNNGREEPTADEAW